MEHLYSHFPWKGQIMLVVKVPVDSKRCHLSYVFVNGSLAEKEGEKGLLHLLEHLFFRDASCSRVRDVLNRLEILGCAINAYTCDSHIRFYVDFLPEFVDEVILALKSLVFGLHFTEEDVRVEREVVYREMVDLEADPDSNSTEKFFSYLNGEGYTGTIGRKDDILSATHDKLMNLYANLFGSSNCICLLAGPDSVLDAVSSDRLEGQIQEHPLDLSFCQYTPSFSNFKVVDENIGTSFFRSGFAYGHRNEVRDLERTYLQVAACMLGGGFFSPLFQRIRDTLGYCYTITSAVSTGPFYDNFLIFSNLDPRYLGKASVEINGILQSFLFDKALFDFAKTKMGNDKKWESVSASHSCQVVIDKLVHNFTHFKSEEFLDKVKFEDFAYFLNKGNFMSPLNFTVYCLQ